MSEKKEKKITPPILPLQTRTFHRNKRRRHTDKMCNSLTELMKKCEKGYTRELADGIITILAQYVSPDTFKRRVVSYHKIWKVVDNCVAPADKTYRNGYHYYKCLTEFCVALSFFVRTGMWAVKQISLGGDQKEMQIRYFGFENKDKLPISEYKQEMKDPQKRQTWLDLQVKFTPGLLKYLNLPPNTRKISAGEAEKIRTYNSKNFPFKIVEVEGECGPYVVIATRTISSTRFNQFELEYKGSAISLAESIKQQDCKQNGFLVECGCNLVIDGHPDGFVGPITVHFMCCYVNHSSTKANVVMYRRGHKVYFRAIGMADIEAGKPILICYGDDYFEGGEPVVD